MRINQNNFEKVIHIFAAVDGIQFMERSQSAGYDGTYNTGNIAVFFIFFPVTDSKKIQ